MSQARSSGRRRSVQAVFSNEIIEQVEALAELYGWSRSQAIARLCEFALKEIERRRLAGEAQELPPLPPRV